VTYSSAVTVSDDFVVKMSANETATETIGDTKKFWFMSSIPIPSYLLALVVGNLETRVLGRRTTVTAEPEQIEAAAWEMSELDLYLDRTEAYLTPYIWGKYNVLILPPSCPNGAMENPLLTTTSPTAIVGDKSQASLSIHEMAHSWFGNTVTNQNWEDFWLNEGFAVFIERQIDAEIYGE